MNITTIYHGINRINLKDELDLCDDGSILSNKDKLLKIRKLLGVESKICDGIPNKVWNMADMDMKGRKLMRSKQIFKEFSDKIAFLICPYNPNFH